MKGFSLIELLCALTISIIGLTALMSVFAKYSFLHERYLAMADARNSERFATYILRQSIQEAGFIGCATLDDHFNLKNAGVDQDHQLSFANSIQVYSTNDLRAKGGEDIIEVRKMSSDVSPLMRAMDNSNQVTVLETPIFKSGDNILVSDCQHAVMAHVQRVSRSRKYHTQRLTLSAAIHAQFDTDAKVGLLERLIFFVTTNDALYEINGRDQEIELIPNVIDLKAMGYSRQGDKDIVDWRKAVMLSIDLKLLNMHRTFSFAIPLIERWPR